MIYVPLLLLLAPQASPAELRLRSVVQALNTKDAAAVDAFVREETSEEMRKAIPDFGPWLLTNAKQFAPLAIEEITEREPLVITAILRTSGPKMQLTVGVEADEPHRMNYVMLNAAPPKMLDLSRWTTLRELANQTRNGGELPAVGIAWTASDESIHTAVAGERDVRTHSMALPADLWWIGSVTKSMTATAVARLIEMGKLRWNTTLGEALPDVPMRAEYRNATLEQLMQHRAGAPEDRFFDAPTVDRIVGKEADATKIRARYVADILNRASIGPVGGESRYSNAGYSVLGYIMERTEKKPYAQAMQDLLFGPAKMRSALVGEDNVPGLPDSPEGIHGHVRDGSSLKPEINNIPALRKLLAPAGSAAMTVEDLARYGKIHLLGLQGKNGLLKAETIQRLHRADGPGFPYAAGWINEKNLPTAPFEYHNGSNMTAYADLAIWPSRNRVVAVVTNVDQSGEMPSTLQAAISLVERR